MKILIIGGTKFLGRALVDSALKGGHEVTLFNRGQTNSELYPGLEKIRGDRDGDMEKLGERIWDAVIDTCGYVPRVVKQSVEFLKDKSSTYVFISSISVYAESPELNRTEAAETITLQDPTTEDIMGSAENYGGLKYLCEKTVNQGFSNSVIVRPGLIVGPHDPTNRFTYWPVRIRKGGKILTPKDETYPLQIIDVRDLADFVLHLVETNKTGTYNATGPESALTVGNLYAAAKQFSNGKAIFVPAENKFLLDNEVQPWMEMPLWIPDDTGKSLMQVSIAKAVQDGIKFRSLVETVKDTLSWYDQIKGDAQEWPAGLKAEKEETLLSKLA